MNRREFLINAGKRLCLISVPSLLQRPSNQFFSKNYRTTGKVGIIQAMSSASNTTTAVSLPQKNVNSRRDNLITVFLCGDVMTGRGIDQILPYPSDPQIHEPYLKTATGYLTLAERQYGPIPRPVEFSYIWGDSLDELERVNPDVRIINLETSVTVSNDFWEGKGINYRMHPENIPCITAAKIDCCVLANNHVLDWGYSGLDETMQSLRKAGLKTAGVGKNIGEAKMPAIMNVPGKGRVMVFSYGSPSSGIPRSWAASRCRAGINYLADFSQHTIQQIAAQIQETKRQGDIVITSIHWGHNWGYTVPLEQIRFAHELIDQAGVDIIHGHSSHHPKGIEVYKDKPIIYGCGDFLNDYEGIKGHKIFRGDLGLMYFASLDPMTGKLIQFQLVPTQIKGFRVNLASSEDSRWLYHILHREGIPLGTTPGLNPDNTLSVQWS